MKVKQNFQINYSTKIILFLLSLLGYSTSCENFYRDEYGTPHADFIINGAIKSQSTKQIIQNVQIITTSEKKIWIKDTVYTDQQGKFITSIKEFPDKQLFTLEINDIDGTNYGSFASKDTTISFDGINFTGGDGHWYKGKTVQNIVIYLIQKQ